jgi:hypothetical protein
MAFLWIIFFLAIFGVILYGWAKAVLLVLLIGTGLFTLTAVVWGVYEAIRHPKQKQAAPEPPDPSRVLAQAAALGAIKGATDEELMRLRRMAGLE